MISYLKFLKYFFLQKKIFERYISLNNIVGFIYIYILQKLNQEKNKNYGN
jgi:hypothetical protein